MKPTKVRSIQSQSSELESLRKMNKVKRTTGEPLQTLEGQSDPVSSAFDQYSISNNWIGEEGDTEIRNILWLPPDYQPSTTSFRKGVIVIGGSSGSIFFLKFGHGNFTLSRRIPNCSVYSPSPHASYPLYSLLSENLTENLSFVF